MPENSFAFLVFKNNNRKVRREKKKRDNENIIEVKRRY